MTRNSKMILATALVSGLLAGTAAQADNHETKAGTKAEKSSCKGKGKCSGKDGCGGHEKGKCSAECKDGKDSCKGADGKDSCKTCENKEAKK